ncbi:PREDICTED: histone H3-5-like isoform X2 [Nicrophorus vespilloides]|nr:PREDICTED: histone H3-5-like isoform X2 [Nicrophorus vespilloides]
MTRTRHGDSSPNNSTPNLSGKLANKPKRKKTKNVTICQGSIKQVISKKLIKEMNRLQVTVHDIIPKLPFCRLIKELMHQFGADRIQGIALQGLQAAAEMYLVQLFEDSNLCTHHGKRATLMPPDMKLVLTLRSRYDNIAVDSL